MNNIIRMPPNLLHSFLQNRHQQVIQNDQYLFLSWFSSMNIHDLGDNWGRVRVFLLTHLYHFDLLGWSMIAAWGDQVCVSIEQDNFPDSSQNK